jgi:uncharacterized membrane protein
MDSMNKRRQVDMTWLTKRRRSATVPWTLGRRLLNEAVLVYWGYALLGLLILWGELPLLRGLLAAVLALFGPGYALMAVLFPRPSALDAVERAALAGALSLAVGGILGFLLTVSPWGLSLDTVMVASALLCLLCLPLALVRHLRLTGSARLSKDAGPRWSLRWHRWWAGQGRASHWVTVGLALLLVGGAIGLGWGLMVPATDLPMTEFYVLNSMGQAGDYPTTIVPGQSLPINFGVTSREAEPANYQIEARMAGELLGVGGPMTLRPGETWLGKLRLVLPSGGAAAALDAGTVEFILERDGQPYRLLHLWLEVEDADPIVAAAALGE